MQTWPEDRAELMMNKTDGFQQIHISGFCSFKDVNPEPGRLLDAVDWPEWWLKVESFAGAAIDSASARWRHYG